MKRLISNFTNKVNLISPLYGGNLIKFKFNIFTSICKVEFVWFSKRKKFNERNSKWITNKNTCAYTEEIHI